MKSLCAVFVVVFVCNGLLTNASPFKKQPQQLGASKCTWGPSYWCNDLKSAKDCGAVRHCIQTVWEKHTVPVDNDSICQICKDMVTQARDQLRSNETLDELKQVFEGSCKLIPFKPIKNECCKIADDFIPELVEALSSQMNPDQVCSVAGLCNNAEIDKLLYKYYSGALTGTLKEEESAESVEKITEQSEKKSEKKIVENNVEKNVEKPNKLSCSRCNYIGAKITEKFHSTSRDDILENWLRLCGEMSSFSDACSSIVLNYFNDIYDHFKEELKPDAICHLSGTCSAKYHQHADDPVEPLEDMDALVANGGDDIPCELCEQLIKHLREVLIANTTETEFKQVLEGLCKQTKGFKDECLSIVDQYYDVIYKTLAGELKEKEACFLIGICPKGSSKDFTKGDLMPLLPVFPPAEIKVTMRKKLGASEPKFTEEQLYSMQLPIDHLMGATNPSSLVEGGELCTLCEYVLHFVQEELSLPATEDEIKTKVNGICDKLPESVKGKCHDFVDMYGDSVIALLIQGLNPREICPKLQMCPHNENQQDVEIFSPISMNTETSSNDETDKPTCPLCLFAVEQAQQKIKNDKSKRNIKNVLDHLCTHLPNKLKAECVDFIETYTSELVDMLITDFKPEEICVTLKLCPPTNTFLKDLGLALEENEDSISSSEEESFNEIDSNQELPLEIAFEPHQEMPMPNCILCEELVKIAEKRINKKTNKADIMLALDHACDKLRKTLQPKCHVYVDKYGDKIADLLIKEMEPKIICREIGLCLWSDRDDLDIDEALKYDVIAIPLETAVWKKSEPITGLDDLGLTEPPSCVLCEFVMTKLEMELKNKTEQNEIKEAIEKVCNKLPKTISKSCDNFIEQYANTIFALIGSVPPKEICQKMMLCFSKLHTPLHDEVVECGICYGATKSLLSFYDQHLTKNNIAIHEMVFNGCANLPAKYYDICSQMVSIYGHSIRHLYEKNEKNEANICTQIGKCYDNSSSLSAFVSITA